MVCLCILKVFKKESVIIPIEKIRIEINFYGKGLYTLDIYGMK